MVDKKFRDKHQELRNICFATSRLFIALLLQQYALVSMREKDVEIAYRWVEKGIYQPENYCPEKDSIIAMDLDGSKFNRGTGNVDSRNKTRPRF